MQKPRAAKKFLKREADCAFNLACCHAQCDRLDDAETWLRRAVAWGVRDVDLMKDKHLAPLRAHDVALCMNLSEALRPAPVRQAAVLQRSRRQRSGGAMAALIRQEKERQAANEDEDIDDFWKDEKDDDGTPVRRSRNMSGEMCLILISTRTSPSLLAASRCVETPSRHRRDSCPSLGPSGPRREKCAAQVRGGGLGL